METRQHQEETSYGGYVIVVMATEQFLLSNLVSLCNGGSLEEIDHHMKFLYIHLCNLLLNDFV